MKKLFITSTLLLILISTLFYVNKRSDNQWYLTEDTVFVSNADSLLLDSVEAPQTILWQSLLPANEKSLLQKYMPSTTDGVLSDQILATLTASSDEQYIEALQSFNTVSDFDDALVAIPGFIVPLEYYDDKSVRRFFIVPYYGACIHFPPPPPNQIIMGEISQGFSEFDMTQAFLFSGQMKRQLFEDVLGTSAYSLNVVAIANYTEDPDDFRQH